MWKTGVLLHAICVMSNHHHLVITDVRGVLPVFLRELHRAIAKALNLAHNQVENLWAAEPASAVVLASAEDVLDKMAYLALNPVEAGLVASPSQWPGLRAWLPTHIPAPRPDVYFANAPLNERPAVEVTEAPMLATMPDWRNRLKSEIQSRVASVRARFAREGRKPLGPKVVKSQSILARATSQERKGFLPTVSAKARELRESVVARLHAFRASYAKALQDFRGGNRDAEFPPGTWWMRVFHQVRVAEEACLDARHHSLWHDRPVEEAHAGAA
jgi:hypothetical protein